MILTTLCYIENNDDYLVLHRVKRKVDVNEDKWVGVGGHFMDNECPFSCVKREVREETSLDIDSFKLRGVVTFISDCWETDYMFLYTASINDELRASIDVNDYNLCDEGNLRWVNKKELLTYNIWEGDKIFLELLESGKCGFDLKLTYRGNQLIEAMLDGIKLR